MSVNFVPQWGNPSCKHRQLWCQDWQKNKYDWQMCVSSTPQVIEGMIGQLIKKASVWMIDAWLAAVWIMWLVIPDGVIWDYKRRLLTRLSRLAFCLVDVCSWHLERPFWFFTAKCFKLCVSALKRGRWLQVSPEKMTWELENFKEFPLHPLG